jgi:hypothetical protein
MVAFLAGALRAPATADVGAVAESVAVAEPAVIAEPA